jgi:signal transduction histidine kinase
VGRHTGSVFSSRLRLAQDWVIQASIVFLAYYLAGKLGQASAERSSNLGPLWPAFGIALAALLRLGNGMIPAVAASAFLVALQSPVPLGAAACQAFSTTFAAFCGSHLLRRASFDCSFAHLRDALNFVLIGAILAPVISATLGTAGLYLSGIQPYANIAQAWLVYWMGDGAGVLLAAPLALWLFGSGLRFSPERLTEYAVLNILLLLLCFAIFMNMGLPPVGQDFLTFSVLPFIAWAAMRFGVPGAAICVILVATVATIATAQGSGPFTRGDDFSNAARLDVFYAILAVTGVVLAALMKERTNAQAQRDDLLRERAVSQARAEAEKEAATLRWELAHLSRVEMINMLSSALAHEINQPLAGIRLNVEAATYLLTKQPVPLEELRTTLNDMRDDARRAGEVLKQARTFVKKDPAAHQDVDLNAAVEDVVRLVQASATKRGIGLNVSLGEQPGPVFGDQVQIQQVIMNLLLNACDAAEGRERPFRQVRLATSFHTDTAIVAVSDTGRGASDETLKRLFEPFYTTKQDGMGLGLAISRSILHAHDGALTPIRNPDGGITFNAEFPLARRKSPASADRAQPDA